MFTFFEECNGCCIYFPPCLIKGFLAKTFFSSHNMKISLLVLLKCFLIFGHFSLTLLIDILHTKKCNSYLTETEQRYRVLDNERDRQIGWVGGIEGERQGGSESGCMRISLNRPLHWRLLANLQSSLLRESLRIKQVFYHLNSGIY